MAFRKSEKPPDVRDFDAYEIVEVHRGELKAAPYNPRVISEKERVKLRRGIEKHGFLAPPVWNARTGNIVGGHQRISILDALKGTKDYRLKVAKIDVDEHREKEANLLLNNAMAQGEWDLDELGSLLKAPDLDLDATGFDTADVYRMFGDAVWEESASEETLKRLSETLDQTEAFFQKQRQKAKDGADDVHFYTVVVFRDSAERDAFTAALGLDANRYQSGSLLRELFEQRRRAGGERPEGDTKDAEAPAVGEEGERLRVTEDPPEGTGEPLRIVAIDDVDHVSDADDSPAV